MPTGTTTRSRRSSSRRRSSCSAGAAAELVKPAYLSIPDEFDPERTLGPEVGAVATLAGFAPDPEQQLCLDVSFALDKRGDPLIFDSTIIAPRQNLKTGFLKQRALGKLYVTKRRLVVWSAHEFTTAQEAAADLEALIDGCDMLRRRVRLTNRDEVAKHGTQPEIQLRSGARLIFKTRTAGGGRGLSGDDLFVDEAFAAQAGQMGAVLPIMLARPGSQVDFASSACRPESAYLAEQVEVGRSGRAGRRSFYIEFCAPPPAEACDLGGECDHARGRAGCGCDKPEVIVLAHSAVIRGRISLDKIVDLRRKLPAGEYAREIMGWHDEVVDDRLERPFTVEEWNELDLRDGEEPPAAVTTFAIEMDVDRAFTSISAAAPMLVAVAGDDDEPELVADGRTYVEFVERERGRGWVVARCKELEERHGMHGPVVFAVDGGGPAAPLIEPLEAAGLDVVVLSAADVIEADAEFTDEVKEGLVVHGPQFELEAAVEGARRRPLGDRGFTIGRRASDDAVEPLKAASFARWAIGQGGGPNLW